MKINKLMKSYSGYLYLLLALLSPISLVAQQAEVVAGQILFQVKEGVSPMGVVEELNHAHPLTNYAIPVMVSEHMRVWISAFDETGMSSEEALRQMRSHGGVSIAQVNHVLKERILPDDPFFGNQWHHQNAGDHDIDSELAWDLTTGGNTATGDRIVACVVETGGASWGVSDLVDNHWINQNEIPENGIDDDDNGYTDDVDGWDVQSNDDDLPEGNHGTQVSGMIGATGNNNMGIVGVNWDVDIMQVRMGGISEANAIAAYTYPLIMRKLYNQTNGDRGAFVVVTNSSWGTDFGQAADAPLWCAMYDSLGVYGVLSCAATANNNVNIDLAGDLPTTCPSNYLISVTATDNADVRDFSGYGTIHVDLGAPGDQVYLANNNGYGNVSGTSFASPCVAGAVALIYSAPCASLMIQAYADPAGVASIVRDYVLNGTDGVSNLANEVATGGRLNVNNSLQLLMNECQEGGCIYPFSIEITPVPGTQDYFISWGITEAMESFNLRYRPSGEVVWTMVEGLTTNVILVSGLLSCTTYEFQLQAMCGKGESEWSPSYLYETDGCCVNPSSDSFEVQFNADNELTLTWEDIFAATGYNVVLTFPGGSELLETSENYLTYLYMPCTEYSVSVFSICVGEEPLPNEFTFSTPGCGSCQDLEYCEVTGNSNLEYIEQVVLNTINHLSESDDGYGDYTDVSTELFVDGTYSILLTPGYAGFGFNEQFKVWIDYNSDGQFDSSNEELILTTASNITSVVEAEFTVPSWVQSGSHVRMRVSMSYGGDSTPTESCGDLNDGEAEDYCISFLPVGLGEAQGLEPRVFPNPVASEVTVNISLVEGEVFSLYNSMGQEVLAKRLTSSETRLDLSHFPVGQYHWMIRGGQNLYHGSLIKI